MINLPWLPWFDLGIFSEENSTVVTTNGEAIRFRDRNSKWCFVWHSHDNVLGAFFNVDGVRFESISSDEEGGSTFRDNLIFDLQ